MRIDNIILGNLMDFTNASQIFTILRVIFSAHQIATLIVKISSRPVRFCFDAFFSLEKCKTLKI